MPEERQMTVNILISECNDHRGRWVALLYEAQDMESLDESILRKLAGYGETALEAAANLLAYAESERRRR